MGEMEGDQSGHKSTAPGTICQNCGAWAHAGTVCPRCGSDLNHHQGPSPVGAAKPGPLRQPGPTRGIQVQDGRCSLCGQPLVRKASQLGTVCVIIGMGLLSLGAPLLNSFVVSIVGFIIIAFGIWRQANPTFKAVCPNLAEHVQSQKRCVPSRFIVDLSSLHSSS